MNNTFADKPFRSAKTLSNAPIGFLYALICCYAIFVLLSIIQMASALPEVDTGDGEKVGIGFIFIGLVGLLELVFRLITIVVFLMWIHKVYSNLPSLGASNLEYTPGWAVGWWFIPFANLVKPYRVVREIYNESDSEFDPDSFLSSTVGTASILGFWWGTWIAGNIVGRISDKFSDDPSSTFFVIFILYCILHSVSAFLLIKIIRTITEQQNLRFEKLARMNAFESPPPPPVFNEGIIE